MAVEAPSYRRFDPLRIARLHVTLRALEPIPLFGYPGPALRGMLGNALEVFSAGPWGERGGPDLFALIFEAPPKPAHGRDQPPPAYILHLPHHSVGELAAGERLSFTLDLFGPAAEHGIAVCWALLHYGMSEGLGPQGRRGRFCLDAVEADTPRGPLPIFGGPGVTTLGAWDPAWTWGAGALAQHLGSPPAGPVQAVVLDLITPLDLRSNGRPREHVEFIHLAHALFWTAETYLRCLGGASLELDWAPFRAAALGVAVQPIDVRWRRFDRASQRRPRGMDSPAARAIPVEGRLGHLQLRGDLTPFVPFLDLGRILHLGKGRVMGMGEISWWAGTEVEARPGMKTARSRARVG